MRHFIIFSLVYFCIGNVIMSQSNTGMIDREGNTIIPFRYQGLLHFSEGLCVASMNGEYGFLDRNGNTAIPFNYDRASSFSQGLAAVEQNRKWGFIDLDGNTKIPFRYDLVYTPNDRAFNYGLAVASLNNKVGVINLMGETVLQFEYSAAEILASDLILASKNGKYRLIDNTGQEVSSVSFDGFYGNFSEGLLAVHNNYQWGYIDQTGKVVVPLQFQSVEPFNEGLAAVCKSNKCGFIDRTGQVAISLQYASSRSFNEGVARVENNDGYDGFVNSNGELIVPFRYKYASDFSEGLAIVRDGNRRRGFINKTGSLVIPCSYNDANDFSEGMALVEQNDRQGVINQQGQVIVPLQYQGISFGGFQNGNLILRQRPTLRRENLPDNSPITECEINIEEANWSDRNQYLERIIYLKLGFFTKENIIVEKHDENDYYFYNLHGLSPATKSFSSYTDGLNWLRTNFLQRYCQ